MNMKRTRPNRLTFLLAAVACALLLASCTFGPETVKEPVEPPQEFSTRGTAPRPERWWTALKDERLNVLVGRALEDNFSLKSAWDRLDLARAVARKQGAPLWPSLDGSAGLSRSVQEAEPPVGGGTNRTYQTEYSLGLTASYEVDLWGRVRAARDAAVLEAEATRQDLHAAALSLSGQVASTWYRLVEQRAQLTLLERQIQTNERYLELVGLRFQKGEVGATDVLQQRKLLESTRTERAQVQSQIETLEHQLAVLTGRVPTGAELPTQRALPELPPLPETGVPADWMRVRPDIRAAFLRVRSSNRDIAAAIADRFPRLSLTGTFSTAGPEPSDLFEEWLARLAGNLAQPIFDAGRREAEVDRTRAAARQSLHSYGQSVLTGMREVEDALTAERQQRRATEGIRRQLELSNRTVTQLMQKYRNGTVNFLRVLDELRTQQQLQRSLLTARGRLVRDRIDLHLALGGSWDLERPEGDAGETMTQTTGPGDTSGHTESDTEKGS